MLKYFFHGKFILCLLLASANAQEPNQPITQQDQPINNQTSSPLAPSQSLTGAKTLADQLADEAIWLEIADGKVLTLNQPHLSKSSKGALVIFSSIPLSKTPLGLMQTLRLTLPYQGWQTMAVDTSSIARNDTAMPPSDSSDGHLPQIIDAVIKHLSAQGMLNTVFLTDNRLVTDIVKALPTKDTASSTPQILRALILVNTHAAGSLSTAELRSIFNNKELPIIDTFIGDRQGKLMRDMARHKGVAKSQGIIDYSQLQFAILNQRNDPDHYNAATNRLRGALDRVAKGTEIKNGPSQTADSNGQ